MVIQRFPPHECADEHGLLAIGGDLEVESLLLAYRNGIFPWPLDEQLLAWFSPPERCILWLKDFRPNRSLRKARTQTRFHFATDRSFLQVVTECAVFKNRKGQRGTWITNAMVHGYEALHKAGFAHSIECYDGEALVGGLYGVCIGSFFAGESMFYRASNASKLALWFLVELLSAQGIEWIDCQVKTPLLLSLGAVETPRQKFLELVARAVRSRKRLDFKKQVLGWAIS